MAWIFIPAAYCFCHFLTTGYMGWVRDPKGPVYYRPYYHCQNKSFLEPNGTSDHDKLAYWTHKPVITLLQRTVCRLDALLFTATAWIFIPAYCFAIS